MSFAMTVDAVRLGQKTVTRRIGWDFVREGDELLAVDRSRGGSVLATIRVTKVSVERLSRITKREVEREGMPGVTPQDFVQQFCAAFGCHPDDQVRRIEFEYIDKEKG